MIRLVATPESLQEHSIRLMVAETRAQQRRKDRRRRLVLLVLAGLVLFVLLPGIAAWAVSSW